MAVLNHQTLVSQAGDQPDVWAVCLQLRFQAVTCCSSPRAGCQCARPVRLASLCHYRVTSYIDDWLLLNSEGCFGVSGAESPMNSGYFFFWPSLSGVSFVRCLLTIVYSLSRSVYSMYLVPQ